MPLPRFSTLDPERRAAILHAAAEEFARAGLEGASYNRIIARAGVSKGAMYYYFDNKEDLFVTVVADLVERAASAIGGPGPFRDAAGFWREMRSLCARALQFFLGDPTFSGLGKQLVRAGGDSPLGHAVELHTRRLAAFTAELLRQGQRVGAVRLDLPVELLAHLLTGLGDAFDRWLVTRWESMAPAELAAIPDRIVDLFARLAAPEGPAVAPEPKTTKRKP